MAGFTVADETLADKRRKEREANKLKQQLADDKSKEAQAQLNESMKGRGTSFGSPMTLLSELAPKLDPNTAQSLLANLLSSGGKYDQIGNRSFLDQMNNQSTERSQLTLELLKQQLANAKGANQPDPRKAQSAGGGGGMGAGFGGNRMLQTSGPGMGGGGAGRPNLGGQINAMLAQHEAETRRKAAEQRMEEELQRRRNGEDLRFGTAEKLLRQLFGF